ncbi:MAG: DMT family transporter [Betaproteobacteria bacterium]|nr:DMT family transporter [Betaproteobacteria bacterium]
MTLPGTATFPGALPMAGLVLSAISLGSGHVFARFAFANGVNILTAATLRSAFACLLLLALLRVLGMRLLPLPLQTKGTVVLGLLIAMQTVMVQVAVSLMPVTLAILLFYTFPFFTGVASALLGDEPPSWRLAIALVAAFAGLALVLNLGSQPINPLGVAAALGASVAFTGALVLTPRLAPGLAAPLRTFLMLGTAALIFMAAAGAGLVLDVAPQAQTFALPVDARGWIGLSGLVLFYSLGFSGVFLVLPRLGATQTAIVLNMEPVAVAVIAWLALGEALGALQVLGALLVVAAVIFFQVRRR